MNIHHGRIGDIWKHLPLAEVLSIEKPTLYWDAYAGSAEYPLTHSWERDYGVFHFLEKAGESPDLRHSAFLQLLIELQNGGRDLSVYPGSPALAMTLLGQSADYLFCDIDARSIDSIRFVAQTKGLSEAKVRCILGDGVTNVRKTFSELPGRSLGDLFVLIDPYDPFERGEGQMHGADLFFQITSNGVKAVLWYGWDTPEMHKRVWKLIEKSFRSQSAEGSRSYWCGEIALTQTSIRPGVNGCGILCGNLGDASVHACMRLGNGLATVYRNAKLPRGCAGAIDFNAVEPWNSQVFEVS
ncbi:MAG: 23S rRNA (adenine(2030)-N(6))-methyltransferase RlmJ [Phycisphaerales bacterium]